MVDPDVKVTQLDRCSRQIRGMRADERAASPIQPGAGVTAATDVNNCRSGGGSPRGPALGQRHKDHSRMHQFRGYKVREGSTEALWRPSNEMTSGAVPRLRSVAGKHWLCILLWPNWH